MKDMKVVWAAKCGDVTHFLRDDHATGICDTPSYSLFMTDGIHYGRLSIFTAYKLSTARRLAWMWLARNPGAVGLPPGDGTKCNNPWCPKCHPRSPRFGRVNKN